ncbi:hypothetical protein [Helicobacter vulpis]|uniref:hypothetical protein n=1 Tax=Helicobacter vulpis TaxID=2316076 RepID=UPI000EB587D1|nr:hypothetical protein [Helicobacter vulpis]
MTRLLGILLLISPLWAVSPNLVQQMQQARALVVKIYEQDFKERYTRINQDMSFSHAMQKEAPTLVKHLQAFVDHIPLLQAFQPKTPKQAQMIQALKALEMYNLFNLLYDSTPEFYCNNHISKCKKMKSPKRVKPFDAKKHTLEFLRGTELAYAPLIEAYHQGLDFSDYLYHLQALQDDDSPSLSMYWMTMDIRADSLDMIKGPKTPALRHYLRILNPSGRTTITWKTLVSWSRILAKIKSMVTEIFWPSRLSVLLGGSRSKIQTRGWLITRRTILPS